ncbi:MAG: hypothetical protein WC749_02055 [Dehalococcoidia bacterium]
MELKCPGFKGIGWFGLWGKCRYAKFHGLGVFCQHPDLVIEYERPYVAACPTEGVKP